MDASSIVGTFEQTSQEGLNDVLKAMEIPDEIIEIILSAQQTISNKLSEDGTIESTMNIGDLSRTYKYKIGEEFEQELLTGEKVKSIMNIEDGKLVEKQLDGKAAGKVLTIEKTDDGLKGVITFKDATGTANFKKTG